MARQPKNRESESHFVPEIRRARFGKLTIYEISESELETLAKGSPDSAYLSFAIALISLATGFSVALATTTIDSMKTFTVFIVIISLGFSIGLLLLILWWRTRQPISCLVEAIRDRLPPEGEPSPVTINDSVVVNNIEQTTLVISDECLENDKQ